jgi:hypothetical protein
VGPHFTRAIYGPSLGGSYEHDVKSAISMEAARIALEQRHRRVPDDAIITVIGGGHRLRVLGCGAHNANQPAYRRWAGVVRVDLRSSAR